MINRLQLQSTDYICPSMLHTYHTLTNPHPPTWRQEAWSITAEDFLSVCVTDEKTHTHADICLIKTFPIDVLLCTALHSSPPPIRSTLASLWAPLFIFIKASLSLLLPLYLNSFSLSSTVSFVAGLSCIEAPIYLLFSPLILPYCCSRRPIASRTRPPQEFCSLCPRHESVSQDNDEELRHAGEPASITSHTSKVFLINTSHRSLLLKLFSLCEEMRSPFKAVLNLCFCCLF